MIKKWILKWIYKNVNICNFEGFKEQASMIALLDGRVDYLMERERG